MGRKQLIAVVIVCLCLFVTGCESNKAGTEQETETPVVEELTEQDKIWLEFLDNLYVHEDVDILAMGDSKTFIAEVEEVLEQKPQWENNVYLEQTDGTRIMYFDEEKRYTSDSIGGFCAFIDKYSISAEYELLQTLGLWNDEIENAFQNETTEDYVEYCDTYYGKVRVAIQFLPIMHICCHL